MLNTLYLSHKINFFKKNDLEVAHPQSGSSSTWFLVELEFENWFLRRGVPAENLSEQRREPKQTQTTYRVDTGIWTQATLVGGKSSHLCTIPCSPIIIILSGSDIKNFKPLVILMALKVKLGRICFIRLQRIFNIRFHYGNKSFKHYFDLTDDTKLFLCKHF